MERRGIEIPLLIGGATTSRQHTAVKIAPEYSKPVVHVLDASRAVDVVSSLLNPSVRDRFVADARAEQTTLRAQYGARQEKPLLSYEAAKANRLRIDWETADLPVPSFLGRREVSVPLAELVPFIDWTFFFHAWELKGRVPAIFDHPQYGARRARPLRQCARRCSIASSTSDCWKRRASTASGRRRRMATTWCCLPMNRAGWKWRVSRCCGSRSRLPTAGRTGRSPTSLRRRRARGGDYLGAFALTAGLGADDLAARFEADHDDYNAIMVKALADRLAEAFAEYLHARARRDWGYGAEERLSNDELVAEKYRGIRPAFGYPACPDHTEKGRLFDLLGASAAGVSLTEHFAMMPAASVSGLYFANPQARYFMVGRLGTRPGERLCPPEGPQRRRDGALAGAESRVRCDPGGSLLATGSAHSRRRHARA